MNTSHLDAAVESAFESALENPQRRLPVAFSPNVTIQTDLYVAPEGSGFRIVCRITDPATRAVVARVKNYGPDVNSELAWPDDITTELQLRGERLASMGRRVRA